MMILLIAWKVRPGQRDAAIQRFKETQGAPPPGVKMLNRWHRADGDGGLTIAESNDPQAVYKWAYQWGDVMELDAHPIIDDAEAAKVLFGRLQHRGRPTSGQA
jgi:hypothetical protein